MRIAATQVQPRKGDIVGNIADHLRFVDLAVAHGADAVIFPELSLTGYEPTLARSLAFSAGDARLDIFQRRSDAHQITIGVGLPTARNGGVCISMALFQPARPCSVYSKQYLHPDELPFFVHGVNFPTFSVGDVAIAPAICYELSIPEHAAAAARHGAALYVASVAKSAEGVRSAHRRLAEIAASYALPVLMVNCVGPADNFVGAGQSAAWGADGALLGALAADATGIVLYDTAACKATVIHC